MHVWKTKAMLGLIWVGSVVLMGSSSNLGDRSWLEWILWAVDAGLMAGLAVTIRHYYRQIKINAIWEYRRALMWNEYVKRHGLSNGDLESSEK